MIIVLQAQFIEIFPNATAQLQLVLLLLSHKNLAVISENQQVYWKLIPPLVNISNMAQV